MILNWNSVVAELFYSTVKQLQQDFIARWNPFQRAFNVTHQLYIFVWYCAEMFFADFKMAAVFLAKLEQSDRSRKQDESIDV